MHGHDQSISMTLAPLSVVYLKYAPVKKRTPKTDAVPETPEKPKKTRKKAAENSSDK